VHSELLSPVSSVLFRLETKLSFQPGCAPDPVWGSLQLSTDLLGGFKGPLCDREGHGKGRDEKKGETYT